MRQGKLEWIMVTAVCSLFILSSNAYATGEIDDFVGEYACSFENKEHPTSPQAGIVDLTIHPDGKIVGITKAATTLPAPLNIINCVNDMGEVTSINDNFITIETTGNSCMGSDDVPLEFKFDLKSECFGALNAGNGYNELTCLDLTDEKGVGGEEIESIDITECKRVNIAGGKKDHRNKNDRDDRDDD